MTRRKSVGEGRDWQRSRLAGGDVDFVVAAAVGVGRKDFAGKEGQERWQHNGTDGGGGSSMHEH